MKTTKEKWLERIREWKASGLTAKEFTQDKPYRASSLVWRQWQLQRDGEVATAVRDKSVSGRVKRSNRRAAAGFMTREPSAVAVPMAQVVRRPVSRQTSGRLVVAGGVVIEVGQARIEVGSGFDVALLQDVVRALRGAA